MHDLIDPPGRNADIPREVVLAHAEGIKERLQQDLIRVIARCPASLRLRTPDQCAACGHS